LEDELSLGRPCGPPRFDLLEGTLYVVPKLSLSLFLDTIRALEIGVEEDGANRRIVIVSEN
jgi:hypothetical protein